MGVALATALFASGAHAATITNNEAKPQAIKVYSADRSENFTILPSDTLKIDPALCPNSCVLSLQNGDEYEFTLGDVLFIEEGAVFSEPPAQGSAGETDQSRQQ